jgi:hypothetical protein
MLGGVPTWRITLQQAAIAPELAKRWWTAIAVAAAAIDAAEVDRDLAAAQASAKRRELLAERHWLETMSGA